MLIADRDGDHLKIRVHMYIDSPAAIDRNRDIPWVYAGQPLSTWILHYVLCSCRYLHRALTISDVIHVSRQSNVLPSVELPGVERGWREPMEPMRQEIGSDPMTR